MTGKVLKLGSTGGDVRKLQIALGVNPADGVFDTRTESAVKNFQSSRKLVADGKVGEKTLEALFTESKSIIDRQVFDDCAKRLGVDSACIKAFAEVESSGNGFLRSGKPKIQYERHWAYKLLKRKGLNADGISRFMPDLVHPHPGAYLSDEGDWLKFDVMAMIDRDVAIQCCSWGTFQVMGFHYDRLGFPNTEEFLIAVSENANKHLDLLSTFILTDLALHNALKRKDFPTVASIYNGPKHDAYDVKMEAAYKRHS